jgi:hypothetical protein
MPPSGGESNITAVPVDPPYGQKIHRQCSGVASRFTLGAQRGNQAPDSNAARDRNSPATAHQTNAQRSPHGAEYQPIRAVTAAALRFGRHSDFHAYFVKPQQQWNTQNRGEIYTFYCGTIWCRVTVR